MKSKGSLRRKLLMVVMLTTLAALVMSAGALLIYELRTYRSAWLDDLRTHADLIALSSAPALTFDDAKVATENLALLKLRPQVEAAAIYNADGKIFAAYALAGTKFPSSPERQARTGHRFEGPYVDVYRSIEPGGKVLGTVYLRARYSVAGRLADHLLILFGITLVSLALAAAVFSRLQHAVTGPILAVARTAQQVVQRRDFGLRVPNTTDDELGVLVDAFNNMVQEVGRRTDALEQSNRDLSVQMEERRKAETALRLADRKKDEFLATLAHELRNPLAPIANGLELLKATDADPDAGRQARDMMERQLGQMVRLIDDLLEVSRITTGKLALRLETLDLKGIIQTALEVVAPMAAEKAHQVEAAMPPGSIWVRGDATRLTQVFANVLSNAVRYTDPNGRIELAVTSDSNQVRISVTDNGIGIAPEMQLAVFEMFMQVDKSLERGRAGLGVGLTLSRQLIELHGGKLQLFSAGLGQGSRFTVSLPLAPPPREEPVQKLPAAEPGPARLRVLLADDNVDFIDSLACLLESEGHVVTTAHDGQTAFESASIDPPDIAFFDIGMPKINGYELAARLRAQPSTRHIVMVAITGWGQDSDRAQARNSGFDHHLVKPVSLEHLLTLLAKPLGTRAQKT